MSQMCSKILFLLCLGVHLQLSLINYAPKIFSALGGGCTCTQCTPGYAYVTKLRLRQCYLQFERTVGDRSSRLFTPDSATFALLASSNSRLVGKFFYQSSSRNIFVGFSQFFLWKFYPNNLPYVLFYSKTSNSTKWNFMTCDVTQLRYRQDIN